MDEDRWGRHLRILAGLSAGAGLAYLVVLGVTWWVIGLAVFPTDPASAVVWTEPFGLVLIALAVVGLTALAAGHGLWRERGWGRTLGLPVCAVSLLSVPFGTAYGVYGLWVLTRDEVRQRLDGSAKTVK